MSRIAALTPPFDDEVASQLDRMMPPGVPPIGLFRTFAKNLPMSDALVGWGGYELSDRLSLSMRDREILINRTCARCRCEYEWGVHVAFFAERVGLGRDEIISLASGSAGDVCWVDGRDRMLVEAADALHDEATFGDDLFNRLAAAFTEAQLLDVMMLCGWYHAISYAANAAQVELEPDAPRFADYAS